MSCVLRNIRQGKAQLKIMKAKRDQQIGALTEDPIHDAVEDLEGRVNSIFVKTKSDAKIAIAE